MHRAILLPLVVLLIAGCSPPAEPVVKETPTTTPEAKTSPDSATNTEPQLTGYAKLDADFEAAVEGVGSRSEQMKLLEQFGQKMLDYAEANADSEDSIKAINWAAARLGGSPIGMQALEILIEKDPDGKNIASLAGKLVQGVPSPKSEELLRSVIENTSDRATKGITSINLVKFFERATELSPFADDPRLVQQMGQEVADYLKQERGDDHRSEMVAILTDLKDNYTDVDYGHQGSVADQAKDILFVYENLSVGAMAMDIEGEDLDGEAFKLSDYRGKVVLLDFWGDW